MPTMPKIQKYMETGVREISMAGTGETSWQGDYSRFVGLYGPFMMGGGNFWDGSRAGRFSSYRSNGRSTCSDGFRPVVVPMP